jgi:hypothetical protein
MTWEQGPRRQSTAVLHVDPWAATCLESRPARGSMGRDTAESRRGHEAQRSTHVRPAMRTDRPPEHRQSGTDLDMPRIARDLGRPTRGPWIHVCTGSRKSFHALEPGARRRSPVVSGFGARCVSSVACCRGAGSQVRVVSRLLSRTWKPRACRRSPAVAGLGARCASSVSSRSMPWFHVRAMPWLHARVGWARARVGYGAAHVLAGGPASGWRPHRGCMTGSGGSCRLARCANRLCPIASGMPGDARAGWWRGCS